MDTISITSDWDEFEPKDYLATYYSEINSENAAILQFFTEAAKTVSQHIPRKSRLLDFGSGPTIYALIAFSKYVSEIHICDYLEANLNEVRRWLGKDISAFDWSEFVKFVLTSENQLDQLDCGNSDISHDAVIKRETLIRDLASQTFTCDAYSARPIAQSYTYEVVISTSCTESITDDKTIWREILGNICSLVKPEGFLVLSTIEGAGSYAVGEKAFQAVCLDSEDITSALSANGFILLQINTIPASVPAYGYKGIITILAQKKGNQA